MRIQRRYTNKARQSSSESQQRGANAESLVLESAAHYLRAGRCLLRKRYEPYKRVGRAGKNGMFKAFPAGSSGPDFELWLSDGRAGMIELKARNDVRIRLADVNPPQASELDRLTMWGQIALVLVWLNGEWFLVDWRAWTHEKKRSLNASDLTLQGASVSADQHGLPMWLDSLDLAIERGARYADMLREKQNIHTQDKKQNTHTNDKKKTKTSRRRTQR